MRVFSVNINGYVKHNETQYKPGEEISGLSEKEKDHLVNAGVVDEVFEEKKQAKSKAKAKANDSEDEQDELVADPKKDEE